MVGAVALYGNHKQNRVCKHAASCEQSWLATRVSNAEAGERFDALSRSRSTGDWLPPAPYRRSPSTEGSNLELWGARHRSHATSPTGRNRPQQVAGVRSALAALRFPLAVLLPQRLPLRNHRAKLDSRTNRDPSPAPLPWATATLGGPNSVRTRRSFTSAHRDLAK
jgi:hypothetical protein